MKKKRNQTFGLIGLTLDPGLYANQRLSEECQKLHFPLLWVDPIGTQLHLKKNRITVCFSHSYKKELSTLKPNLDQFHFLWTRMGRHHHQEIFKIAQYLESLGLHPLNSSQSLMDLRDKWSTLSGLGAQNILIPETQLISSLGLPVPLSFKKMVLKPNQGSQGVGISLVTKTNYKRELSKRSLDSEPLLLLQKYLSGPTIRVLILNHQVLGGIKSKPSSKDFRSNYHQGGKSESFHLSDSIIRQSIKISHYTKAPFIGLDFIYHNNEYYLIDVNGNPGFELFEKLTRVNVAAKIIHYFKKQFSND